jgi:hypothetical protein
VLVADRSHLITQRGDRRQPTVLRPADHAACIHLAAEVFAAHPRFRPLICIS